MISEYYHMLAVREFLDHCEEKRYLLALKIQHWTFGFIRAREPNYLNAWD